ncbi:MAG: glycosyltransferase, partial [Planctomycetota bacterium]|nr:glycosyltransferase [Planctomycetota bacterium]
MSQTTVLFAGGGTGGHIFPGVAIAEFLASDPIASTSICSQRPGDAAMLSGLGKHFVAIPAQPFGIRPRTLLRFVRHWGTCVRTVRGIIQERRKNGPVVMVALGGFVAAPAAQAARAEHCPILLVNLDAVPGRANRWIARFATRTVTAAKVPGLNWEYIQPIVRASAKAPGDAAACRTRLGLEPDRPTLMVTGASLGARTINEFMLAFVKAHGT